MLVSNRSTLPRQKRCHETLMKDLEKLFDLIAFSLAKIQREGDWSPFVECILGGKAHDGQYDFLTNARFRENALHPGNGFGKTEVIAIKHLRSILSHLFKWEKKFDPETGLFEWIILPEFDPEYRTLNIAITIEQAEMVQARIVRYVQDSPALSALGLIARNGVVSSPVPRIRYFTGAETEFKTTKKKAESVEGKEYGYISADEIALEPYLEFIHESILLPRARKYPDSQLDFFATPKGKNAYWRVVEKITRGGGYVRGGSSFENPWIDHDLLRYMIASWSEARIEQTIYGKFIDTGTMMFASRVPVLFDESLSFEESQTGRKYLSGWDLARGRKGSQSDQTVGIRLDVTERPARVVKTWNFQLPWTEKERENINAETGHETEQSSIEREIRASHYETGEEVRLDSTGVGDTLYGILMDIADPVDFRGGRKDELLDHLQAVIDAGLLKAPFIPALADEMTVYQRSDTNLDTDWLMALAIAASGITIDTVKYGTVE